MTPTFTETDFFALMPVIELCLFGCGILMIDFMLRKGGAPVDRSCVRFEVH